MHVSAGLSARAHLWRDPNRCQVSGYLYVFRASEQQDVGAAGQTHAQAQSSKASGQQTEEADDQDLTTHAPQPNTFIAAQHRHACAGQGRG